MHGEFVVGDDGVFGRELFFHECDLGFEGLNLGMGLCCPGEFLLFLVKFLFNFKGILFHAGELFPQPRDGLDVLLVFLY